MIQKGLGMEKSARQEGIATDLVLLPLVVIPAIVGDSEAISNKMDQIFKRDSAVCETGPKCNKERNF